jgi:peptidoglycan/LPS O-acetylase OafA/YrhL
MVVLFHATGMVIAAPAILRYAFNWGYGGVDFFFVLSGFILLYCHAGDINRPERVVRYFGKRFSRIFPAYWAVLAVLIPGCFLAGGFVSPEKKTFGYLLSSALLLPQWDPFLGVAWSLSCEIFFYVIFSLLIVNRWSFFIAALMWLVLIVTNLFHPLAFPGDFLCQARVLEFMAGMGIAWATQRGLRLSRRTSMALIITGVGVCLGAGMAQVKFGFGGVVYPLWFGLAASLIILSLISLEFQKQITAGKGWVVLGDASYAIYLIHYPVLLVIFRALRSHGASLAIWLIGVVVATLIGIAFHLLIEKRLSEVARVFVTRTRKTSSTLVPAKEALSN